MSSRPLAVLAVHPGFVQVRLQSAVAEVFVQPLAQLNCFAFAPAVQDTVVSVST